MDSPQEEHRMANLKQKWQIAVDIKNSVLCAGLDPSESAMKEIGSTKKEWAFSYIESVAPYCAAIKANTNFWKTENDMKTLEEIVALAHSLDMIIIEDCKLADIGSTNDECMNTASEKKIDAITFSPFAGNLKETGEQAKKRNVGIISMCLMSNPEYNLQKNNLIAIESSFYAQEDVLLIEHVPYVKQYVSLAYQAQIYNIDGIVIAAPSKDNHVQEQEIADISKYIRENEIVLVPGVGAQGGNIEFMWMYFKKDQMIVTVGRALMFPQGIKSRVSEHREAALHYKELLNNIRMQKHEL